MNDRYITVTGTKHYYGDKPFEIGRVFECIKDFSNEYDDEAIRVELPYIGTVGYVANTPYTKAKGTMSAGRIYSETEDRFFIIAEFVAGPFIICRVLSETEDFGMSFNNIMRNYENQFNHGVFDR